MMTPASNSSDMLRIVQDTHQVWCDSLLPRHLKWTLLLTVLYIIHWILILFFDIFLPCVYSYLALSILYLFGHAQVLPVLPLLRYLLSLVTDQYGSFSIRFSKIHKIMSAEVYFPSFNASMLPSLKGVRARILSSIDTPQIRSLISFDIEHLRFLIPSDSPVLSAVLEVLDRTLQQIDRETVLTCCAVFACDPIIEILAVLGIKLIQPLSAAAVEKWSLFSTRLDTFLHRVNTAISDRLYRLLMLEDHIITWMVVRQYNCCPWTNNHAHRVDYFTATAKLAARQAARRERIYQGLSLPQRVVYSMRQGIEILKHSPSTLVDLIPYLYDSTYQYVMVSLQNFVADFHEFFDLRGLSARNTLLIVEELISTNLYAGHFFLGYVFHYITAPIKSFFFAGLIFIGVASNTTSSFVVDTTKSIPHGLKRLIGPRALTVLTWFVAPFQEIVIGLVTILLGIKKIIMGFKHVIVAVIVGAWFYFFNPEILAKNYGG